MRPNKKSTPVRPNVVELGSDELDAAERYLRAKAAEKAAKHDKDDAKAQLLTALGNLHLGILPDGRSVIRTTRDFPEASYTRKAYTATEITIDA